MVLEVVIGLGKVGRGSVSNNVRTIYLGGFAAHDSSGTAIYECNSRCEPSGLLMTSRREWTGAVGKGCDLNISFAPFLRGVSSWFFDVSAKIPRSVKIDL